MESRARRVPRRRTRVRAPNDGSRTGARWRQQLGVGNGRGSIRAGFLWWDVGSHGRGRALLLHMLWPWPERRNSAVRLQFVASGWLRSKARSRAVLIPVLYPFPSMSGCYLQVRIAGESISRLCDGPLHRQRADPAPNAAPTWKREKNRRDGSGDCGDTAVAGASSGRHPPAASLSLCPVT
jgi:hypothetical protein